MEGKSFLVRSVMLPSQDANCLVRRGYAPVLRFLKYRNAAEVGVGEEQPVECCVRASERAAVFREHEIDCWTNHGMPHAHDVETAHAIANVRMNAAENREDGF